MPTLAAIRARAELYLSPEVAACAHMSLHDLQQMIAGHYFPSDAQLQALARRMRTHMSIFAPACSARHQRDRRSACDALRSSRQGRAAHDCL